MNLNGSDKAMVASDLNIMALSDKHASLRLILLDFFLNDWLHNTHYQLITGLCLGQIG